MRVLVTEKIADGGLQRLRDAGHEVDVQEGLSPEQLLEVMPGAHALIIRSATQVTAEVLAAGRDLIVVGRAGIGLDNVDVAAATERGVMVVNAPQSNTLSAAEHTMALLLAQARNVPQASAALKAGRWERSKWTGVELSDKTLGIIGLGRIGKLVAQRALAFGMKLVAYDPFVSEDRARQLSVELLSLEDLMARADFITLHLAKTPETAGLIDAAMLARAKPSLRVINVARGGIIDEQALADAIASGTIAGAALDVFDKEPTTESPLFELDQVVVTPHLGASTAEAQDKAGDTIADMVELALAGDFVPYAVNVSAAEASETVRPYLGLAEQLGRIFAGLCGECSDGLEIEYQGQIAEYDTRILTLSLLKGFFSVTSGEPVSYVNAPQVADLDHDRPRLRQPDHDPWWRPQHRGHPRGPEGDPVGGDDRRPHRRRAARRAPAGGAQQRPARHDRQGRHPGGGGGRQHRRHGGRLLTRGCQGAHGAGHRPGGAGRGAGGAAGDRGRRLGRRGHRLTPVGCRPLRTGRRQRPLRSAAARPSSARPRRCGRSPRSTRSTGRHRPARCGWVAATSPRAVRGRSVPPHRGRRGRPR